MSARRFGTQSLVRLLGNWQETSSRTPLWRQLAEALRLLILDGRLTLQTRLPGERELAFCRNAPPIFLCLPASHLRLISLPPPSAPGRRSIRPSSTL